MCPSCSGGNSQRDNAPEGSIHGTAQQSTSSQTQVSGDSAAGKSEVKIHEDVELIGVRISDDKAYKIFEMHNVKRTEDGL